MFFARKKSSIEAINEKRNKTGEMLQKAASLPDIVWACMAMANIRQEKLHFAAIPCRVCKRAAKRRPRTEKTGGKRKMKFTKMQGCGNDYVYVNCFQETVEDPSGTARRVSDRHYGIGSDGLILIKPSARADCEMDMYNLDGSRGSMCGNGIRCVGKYVYDHGLVDRTSITVDTQSGIKYLDLTVENGRVSRVRVNMGSPELEAKKIPVLAEGSRAVDEAITAGGKEYRMTCVSMGNPHAVIFTEQVDRLELEKVGPLFETHSRFPDRVNTEFVEVLGDGHVRMRVWERGSGETLACGTGACAVAVAAILNHKTSGNRVTVELLGGTLEIEWDREKNLVYMTGPAVTVFDGEIEL